jgi:hypothetical protein
MASAGFRKLLSAIRTKETALPGIETQFQARQAPKGTGGLGTAGIPARDLAVIADGFIAGVIGLLRVSGVPWVGNPTHPLVVFGRVRDGPPAFIGHGQ